MDIEPTALDVWRLERVRGNTEVVIRFRFVLCAAEVAMASVSLARCLPTPATLNEGAGLLELLSGPPEIALRRPAHEAQMVSAKEGQKTAWNC
jgi:hypothetical protein